MIMLCAVLSALAGGLDVRRIAPVQDGVLSAIIEVSDAALTADMHAIQIDVLVPDGQLESINATNKCQTIIQLPAYPERFQERERSAERGRLHEHGVAGLQDVTPRW